ncbi:unnamed protein product [Mycena citricolor]|uniref:F-box domain-containing protein n=1 Tax=Mycena citricolor TaxID=2018698 RepID=A0AAD2H6P7_9AGAR|nr:unnamed protein product [Mycena citricolor]
MPDRVEVRNIARREPIERFPSELLGEIFAWARDGYLPTAQSQQRYYSQEYSILDPLSPPLIFTRVCSRWYTVAKHTPSLWNHVHLPATSRISAAALDGLLRRSGALSLHVTLANEGRPFWKGIHRPTALLRHLLRNESAQQRLATLDLRGYLEWLIQPDADYPAVIHRRNFPKLKIMEVYSTDMTSPEVFATVLATFQTAAALHCVSLISPVGRAERGMLPWHTLTEISIDTDLSFEAARDIVMDAPRLNTCTFTRLMVGDRSTVTDISTGALLVHDQMKDLAFGFRSGNPAAFFDAFAFPALTRLEIGMNSTARQSASLEPDWDAILLGLQRRSSFALSALSLYDFPCPATTLMEYLTTSSGTLQELILEDCGAHDPDLLRFLTLDSSADLNGPSTRFPALREMALLFYSTVVSPEPLVRFIESAGAHGGRPGAGFPSLRYLLIHSNEIQSSRETARINLACARSEAEIDYEVL